MACNAQSSVDGTLWKCLLSYIGQETMIRKTQFFFSGYGWLVESAGVNSCTGKALNKRNPSKYFSLNIMKQWECPSNITLNHGFLSILGTGLEFEFLMQYSWEAMQANMPFYQGGSPYVHWSRSGYFLGNGDF